MRFISVMTWVLLFVSASAVWGQGCAVMATGVSFGGYDSYASLNATGGVNVTCDPGVPFTIRIDAGSNSGGSFTPRKARLAGNTDTLNYNLFRDSPHSEIWGDGTDSTFIRTGAGTGTEEKLIVYGRLPGGQKVASGLYSDTLTVTVEW